METKYTPEQLKAAEKLAMKWAVEAQKEKQRRDSRNEIYSLVERFKGRYVILIGGSGSGKSYEIADRVLDRLEKEPKSRVLGVRAQRNQVSDSQYPLLKSRTKQTFRNEKDYTYRDSRGLERVLHKNGAEILFSGLDDVEKLKSIFDITSIWVEEADQVEEKDVNELDRRLRGYKDGLMQIYLSFNPVSEDSYIKPRFFDNRLKEYKIIDSDGETRIKRLDRTITLRGKRPFEDFKPYTEIKYTDDELNKKIWVWSEEKDAFEQEYYYNTLIIHSTYHDNKFIDNNYYKVMQDLKVTNEAEYNVYGLGQWGVYGGRFFNEFQKHIHVVEPFPIPSHWNKYTTKDYGLDMLANYWIAMDTYGNAYVYKELYESNLIISEAAKRIKAVNGTDKVICKYAPPDLDNRRQETGKSALDIFRENGESCVKAGNDRVDGWLAMKEWLKVVETRDEQTGKVIQTAKLKIFNNCTNLIRCLPQAKQREDDPNDVDNEPHEITHSIDAIRYFCIMRSRPTSKTVANTVKSWALSEDKPRNQGAYDSEVIDKYLGGWD